jgi:hypothetical protein
MRTYEQIKEEIIETNYYLALLLDQKNDEMVYSLKLKLNNLIDEALKTKKK